jgi:hypothetical protein
VILDIFIKNCKLSFDIEYGFKGSSLVRSPAWWLKAQSVIGQICGHKVPLSLSRGRYNSEKQSLNGRSGRPIHRAHFKSIEERPLPASINIDHVLDDVICLLF